MIIDFGNDQKGGGGRAPIIEALSITANGTYEAPKEIDGYSPVNVDVKAKVQEVNVTYTQNGVNEIVPDQGMDGISKATVTVNVPDPYLVPLVATENKTYNPGPDEDGFSSVEVNVPGGAGAGSVDFGIIGYDNETIYIKQANADLAYSKQKYDEWDPATTNSSYLYRDDKKLVYAPKIDTKNLTNGYGMFSGCSSLISVPLLDIQNLESTFDMFNECSSLKAVPLLDTSKSENMQGMFYGCSSLKAVPLLDTSKSKSMYGTFNKCKSLTTVPLFNTQNVETMEGMFRFDDKLISVPLFNTQNVKTMDAMFDYCSSLTTVPLFNTQNVETMKGMFSDCSALKEIPSFNTSKVYNFQDFIQSCQALETIGELDCSSVTRSGIMIIFDYSQKNLKNLGGFPNLKVSCNLSGPSWAPANKLTKESVMNVINKVAQADPAIEAQPKLTFCSAVYALLTPDDIAIATGKGWTVVDAGF